jgi:hypothetical protein
MIEYIIKNVSYFHIFIYFCLSYIQVIHHHLLSNFNEIISLFAHSLKKETKV